MASIIKRNNNFCVVYSYKDANGTPKQKWETFTDLSDAKNRKKEVEYKESVGTFVVPQCKPLNDLLPEYVALYGKSKWAPSTYQANTALIANYIAPLIGSMKLQDITTRVIEGYYQRLLKYEAADPMCGKRKHQFVSPSTVRSVHKILRSAFEQAVKWELMEKNPVPLLLQQEAEPTEQFLHRSFFQLLAKILQFQSTAHALFLLSLLQMLCTSLPLPYLK